MIDPKIPQGCESYRKRNPHIFGGTSPTAFPQTLTQGQTANPQPHPTPEKRLRQSSRPLMNKLETAWHMILRAKYPGLDFHPQGKTYRLANGLRYSPDFTALIPDENCNIRETAFEVKGKWIDGDSIPKLKMMATTWPEVRLILVWRDKSGQWKQQEILP